MITPTSQLNYDTDPVPTSETWERFDALTTGSNPSYMYIDATYDMLKKIEPILALDDFQEMKAQLMGVYEERYKFVEYAINNPS